MTNAVSLVTKDATLDDLSASDYRDIYDELRQREPDGDKYAISLDKLVTMITAALAKAQWHTPAISKASWSQYHNGERPLNRQMRSELRLAVGLPALPLTVAEATAQASPDASVWRVGDGVPEHVIMVTAPEPITIHVNGAVSIVPLTPAATDAPCNPTYTPQVTPKRQRRYIARPSVTRAQFDRFAALGSTWRDVIDAGLAALEKRG